MIEHIEEKLDLCCMHKRLKPTDIYLFIVNNGNIIKTYEIYSKLTIKTPEQYVSIKFTH